MADTYAIVETGGKQYRVEKGSSLFVERLPDDEGAKVSLRPLMVSEGGKVLATADELGKAKVEAKVTGHVRGPKVRIFKKKPKKGYALRAGHRQSLTRLEITSVKGAPAARKKADDSKAESTKGSETKPKAAPKKASETKAKAAPKKTSETKPKAESKAKAAPKKAADSKAEKTPAKED